MESYKQEFIGFMVRQPGAEVWRIYIEERTQITVLYECGRVCDRLSAETSGRVLCAGNPRNTATILMCCSPAYKGNPLGVVTAIAYSELYGKEVRYCSDRKEEKDHGADKGSFLEAS